MFWGLIMEPNKRYAQTVDQSFHVSMASLDVNTADDNFVQVMFFHNNKHFLLCTLNKKTTCQVPLDLNFQENTEIVFTCNGKGHVHLTGYMIPEELDEDLDEEEEDSEENGFAQLQNNIKKIKNEASESLTNLSRKRKAEESEESSDSDFDMEDDEDGLEDEEESDESEGNEGESDEEEEESEEEEVEEIPEPVKQPLSKKAKKQLQQSQVAHVNGDSKQAKKQLNNTNDAKKEKSQQNQQNANKSQSEQQQKKRTIEGGVSVEDLKVGNGQIAKPGKFVSLYYVGKLTNGKKFDSTMNGDGFKFRLGKGEVIKGWDVGISGMKVGGKRRLTIPASMGYGKKGSPPVIPPNSTLVFDVELKNVS